MSHNRKLRRLLKRLSSDNCDGCGRAFGNCDTTAVGYDNAGVLLHLGACCDDRLGEIVAHSVYFAPGLSVSCHVIID